MCALARRTPPGETACFRCLCQDSQPAGTMATCNTAGVLAPSVAAAAAVQWTKVVKLLAGDREHIGRGLTAFDLWLSGANPQYDPTLDPHIVPTPSRHRDKRP